MNEISKKSIPEEVETLVRLALSEDIGSGDVTTGATIDPWACSTATVTARSAGVLSGMEVAREVARQVDPKVVFTALLQDGDRLIGGDRMALVTGPTHSLLSMERVLLNFLQRLSGVATLTARFVEAVQGTGAGIMDTRKTTPGFRWLEKGAVRHGGGRNHRQGLWDAFMVKDNHVRACGGISAAVARVRAEGRPALWLTVEARTEDEVDEVARLGVNQILLDNMVPSELGRMVRRIRGTEDMLHLGRARIEASGGIDLDNVLAVAESGVDLISIGALTHSAAALDLAMKIGSADPAE